MTFQSTRPRGARLAYLFRKRPDLSFNPRARAGRDVHIRGGVAYLFRFNPRARAGRDALSQVSMLAMEVSIHAPARGATRAADAEGIERQLFQSTRPRGARQERNVVCRARQCFNPRARAGRDLYYDDLTTELIVSIHAPARGATTSPFTALAMPVFQSTRPRGARPITTSISLATRSFNPRARAGRDVYNSKPLTKLNVSIHAPARGATYNDIYIAGDSKFQSTRPRGARLSST